MEQTKRRQIAFRCPDCGTATVGFIGGLASVTDMLRLKCGCGESALELKRENSGKIKLSAPCVYCRSTHGFVLSAEVVKGDSPVSLTCPYSGMAITFLGDEGEISSSLEKSAEELSRVLASFEAKELSDIQPIDDDGELFQDPGAFDSINFLVRDLESEDKIYCHCNKKGERGEYSLRFTDDGIRVVCDRCAAYTDLYLKSQAAAEEYLSLDELTLK